jgi:hypothetical protein
MEKVDAQTRKVPRVQAAEENTWDLSDKREATLHCGPLNKDHFEAFSPSLDPM